MKAIALTQVKCCNTLAECANENRIAALRLARDMGCTWQEIAHACGISRQTAHKRFGPLVGEPNEATIKATAKIIAFATNGDGEPPHDGAAGARRHGR